LDRIITLGIAAGILVSVALVIGVVAIAFPAVVPPVELLPTLVFTAAVVVAVSVARRVGVLRSERRPGS